jgi:hypothetical protein
LHIIASSRKVFDNSFSKANVKLLPSAEKNERRVREGNVRRLRTNNEGKILKFTRASLILNRRQPFTKKLLRVVGSLFIDGDLRKTFNKQTQGDKSRRGRTIFIDSAISRHDIPMLMAVSCRSPVSTQT